MDCNPPVHHGKDCHARLSQHTPCFLKCWEIVPLATKLPTLISRHAHGTGPLHSPAHDLWYRLCLLSRRRARKEAETGGLGRGSAALGTWLMLRGFRRRMCRSFYQSLSGTHSHERDVCTGTSNAHKKVVSMSISGLGPACSSGSASCDRSRRKDSGIGPCQKDAFSD